ncbi:WecB/TagA/CpsF family glycosyltransferase [Geodermatophilus sp. SYSU D00742]
MADEAAGLMRPLHLAVVGGAATGPGSRADRPTRETPAGGRVVDLPALGAGRPPLPDGAREPAAAGAPSDVAATLVAEHLAALHDQGGACVSVSWLNHHSAQVVLRRTPEVLDELTYIGVDGLLLRRILGRTAPRTSADLVLPALLGRLRAPRVAIVGGTPAALPGVRRAIARLLPPGGRIVAVRDGFEGLPRGRELDRWLARHRPTVVLAGLGAPLQDEFVCEVARRLPTGLAVTCGGFLDQVQQEGYYPKWAYPLKLNWLVRLAREPRRLWRRYTVDAVTAVRAAARLRTAVEGAEGFRRLRYFALPDRQRGAVRQASSS